MSNFGLRADYDEYVVKKGDSLYSIANKYGVPISELSDVNMLTNTVIYPGQVLLVPRIVDEKEVFFENYTTKPGDTIDVIARRLGIDPSLIGTYNDFGKLHLVDKQTLKIPRTNTYTIKDGETLESVLRNTRKSAPELLSANAETWLKAGKTLNL